MKIGLEKLKKELEAKNIDGMLVSNKSNRIYISGFTGSSAMIYVSKNREIIITDPRYFEQIKLQAPEFEVIDHEGAMIKAISELINEENIKSLGYEQDDLSARQYLQLKNLLPNVSFIPLDHVIEKLRSVKEVDEIEQMKIAAEITDLVFDYFLKIVKPGKTELEVAAEIDYYMRKNGASDRAFETIVASGWRTSLPHGHASNKRIEENELVMVDFGVVYNCYYTDITRTLAIGKVDKQLRDVYYIVKNAQKAGINAIKPGISCSDIDSACRRIINESGYGSYFAHGTGHGIGLSCHEYPLLNPSFSVDIVPGMVFTVEPGIYIPNLGGVRIEDDVYINQDFQVELLTKSSREWMELS